MELVCHVQGYPEPRVQFCLNDRVINSNENYTIGELTDCLLQLYVSIFHFQNTEIMENGVLHSGNCLLVLRETGV